ncbi:MAG: 2-keto-4-pentenoate hydratase [Ktedonobacteraceae bacterium]
MNLNQAENSLLTRVREARTSRKTTMPRYSAVGVDLEGAYRIQAALGEHRELKGYKFGLISPAKQAQMGISAPIYGRVYAEMLLESPVHVSQFIQPRIEPELAVVLRDDVSVQATPAAARLAVAGVFLGVDFLDSIWEGYHFSIAEVVADNASGGGFLLGKQPLSEPLTGRLSLYLNGELLTEGPVEALGDIGERLSWLAKKVGGLRAGQVIFLGSPAAALPARPGVLELYGPQESMLTAMVEK